MKRAREDCEKRREQKRTGASENTTMTRPRAYIRKDRNLRTREILRESKTQTTGIRDRSEKILGKRSKQEVGRVRPPSRSDPVAEKDMWKESKQGTREAVSKPKVAMLGSDSYQRNRCSGTGTVRLGRIRAPASLRFCQWCGFAPLEPVVPCGVLVLDTRGAASFNTAPRVGGMCQRS